MYRKEMITSGFAYGYMTSGIGRAKWHRMTIAERVRLWKRRRKTDDLAGIRW